LAAAADNTDAAEQVRAYLAALSNGSADTEFTDLAQAAEEAWPILKQALESKNSSKITAVEEPTDYCPRHRIGLPTREAAKLRSVGIGMARNCCGTVVLWRRD
jgi:hypothetical protein